MASPVEVGAPNTYYTEMLKTAAAKPDITTENLARTIMEHDRDYTVYTLIDNKELRNLPAKLNPLLSIFMQDTNLNMVEPGQPIFDCEDEIFYDLKEYFNELSIANNNSGAAELQEFQDWCDNQLITIKAVKDIENSNEFSGLSIYVPSGRNESGRYNYLEIYKNTELENLFILTNKFR